MDRDRLGAALKELSDDEVFGSKELSDAEVFGAGPSPTNAAVAENAANKGIASIPDMLLNAPTNLLNLGKAGVGTAATALGRPDLAPDLTETPDLARRAMEATGFIKPITPQGPLQKGIDTVTQGVVAGALTGGASIPRTIGGAAMGGLSSGAAGIAEAAGGSPAAVASAGLLPAAAGRAVPTRSGKTPLLKSGDAVKDDTFARGNAEGLVVPPSAMKSTWIGDRIEGIGGKAALGQQAALNNQPIVNNIARREAGLAPREEISVKSLERARDRLAAPYRAVEALPGLPAGPPTTQMSFMRQPMQVPGQTPPTPAELVRDWKSNNTKITDLWADYKSNHKIETLEEYRNARTKQETIEKDIEKAAIAAGKLHLVPELRRARVALKKNFDVERALNLGNGNVDAAVLGRMYDHGAKFDGGLETIAKFQQAFPNSMREASKVPAPGVSKLEGWGALSLGLAGHAMGLPGGELLAALPLAVSPSARAFSLSKYKQGGRKTGRLAELAEAARRAGPVATASLMEQHGTDNTRR